MAIRRNDISVSSRDLQKVIRLHKSFPKLHFKTVPSAIRQEIKPLRQQIKQNIITSNWSRKFQFRKGAKTQDLTEIKTRTIKKPKETGVELSPRHSGPSKLMEDGSRPRKTSGGADRGIMIAKPAYGPAWNSFKSRGKTTIQRQVIKETIVEMDRMIRKSGLK